MGDRANCIIRVEGRADVWLYTHWTGTELPSTVQNALGRRERWSDDSYLARIIFCEMVKGQEAEPTGFGISTYQCDNEHRYIVVEPDKERISFYDEVKHVPGASPVASWSFHDYVNLDKKTIERAYDKYASEEPEGPDF